MFRTSEIATLWFTLKLLNVKVLKSCSEFYTFQVIIRLLNKTKFHPFWVLAFNHYRRLPFITCDMNYLLQVTAFWIENSRYILNANYYGVAEYSATPDVEEGKIHTANLVDRRSRVEIWQNIHIIRFIFRNIPGEVCCSVGTYKPFNLLKNS